MQARLRTTITIVSTAFLLTIPATVYASAFDETLPDPQTLSQMEQRALQAPPRDQCFLYTELVHTMTELAGQQILQGDADHASTTLKKVEHYAQLIHLNLAKDTKRLKNSEMLMHHTTLKLNQYLHSASNEDRPVLESTLKQLDRVQDDLLNQVFSH